jgi:hypothetical protein
MERWLVGGAIEMRSSTMQQWMHLDVKKSILQWLLKAPLVLSLSNLYYS